MTTKKVKKISESAVIMRELVMPQHTNPHNTIFGGVVMSWIDVAAAMVAQNHAQRQVVTVHIDNIFFMNPIKVGHQVIIKASVNYVGTSSMVIGVKVEAQDPITGFVRQTTKAYLTFVALDELGHPTTVPQISLSSAEEKRRFQNAKKRLEAAKKLRKKLL